MHGADRPALWSDIYLLTAGASFVIPGTGESLGEAKPLRAASVALAGERRMREVGRLSGTVTRYTLQFIPLLYAAAR